jgi:uncharacterized protein YndB with AHSA1/START domain
MYIANAQTTINVPAIKVWEALTSPEIVKKYLFGTNVVSDWQKGGSIFYKGEWDGKPYEDKGEILEIEPNKMLKTTYFSSMSGQEDVSDNYDVITYTLVENGDKTTLTISTENIKDQASANQSAENWNTVLKGMKDLLEQES